jgi:hypothetical protein
LDSTSAAAVARRESRQRDAKLQAAKQLQATLKLIPKAEPPYDIFVRWKPSPQRHRLASRSQTTACG